MARKTHGYAAFLGTISCPHRKRPAEATVLQGQLMMPIIDT